MTPADLALPDKFTAFRDGQLDTALAIACGEERFKLLSASTGTGKSLVYITAAQLAGARTLVLTSTKGLQSQLMADFNAVGLEDVQGQSNYPCVALAPGGELQHYGVPSGCHDGPCHVGVRCSLKPGPWKWSRGCHYYDAVGLASKAGLVVTNYAYWLSIGRYADPDTLGQFDFLVLDEAHAAADILADFCTLEFSKKDLDKLLGVRLPPIEDGIEACASWAVEPLPKAKAREEELQNALFGSGRKRALKELFLLTRVISDLEELAKAHQWRRGEDSAAGARVAGMSTDWVAEPTYEGAKFSPVWAHAYAEEYLFREVPSVLLCSATLQPSSAKYLGVGEFAYTEFDAGFRAERRPLIYVPTTRVDRRMTQGQVRVWMNRIDAIIGARLDRKGIIQARSYARAKEIVERSRHKGVMMTHTPRTTREAVERFKRAEAPCVMVSPSLETGFDFPYDECRYQIVAKVPFVDSRSPVIKARAKADKGYLNHLAARALVQQVGRGMRAADDACEALIIDDHWKWFKHAAKDEFPGWFKRSWKTVTGGPPAPLGI